MNGQPTAPHDEEPLPVVHYTELKRETATVGLLYDPVDDDAWLQSTLIVPVEP